MPNHSPHGGLTPKMRQQLNLGPTGDFPAGQLVPQDEGGIRIAVGAAQDKVVMDFGTPVVWIGFDAQQALDLADSIRSKALRILAGLKEIGAPKKTVCVDLDGVLASYDGWKGLTHFGSPRPGAREFLAKLRRVAHVTIFTTRCKTDFIEGRPQDATAHSLTSIVREWLDLHGLAYDEVYCGQGKPMAAAYLDDRAIAIPPNPSEKDFDSAFDAIVLLL